MIELFGGLVNFETSEKISELGRTINNTMSIKIIEASMEYGIKNGLYTLEECYLMYESLRKIKNNDE